MTIGIYEIQIGDYFYHGSAVNLNKRMHTHKSKLASGTHHNPKMQAIYDKYKTFNFHVVCECTLEELYIFEQEIIDAHFDDKKYMNIAKFVEVPMLGRKHSAETRAKMSAAAIGKPKGNKGKKDSEEVRLKKKEAASKRGIAPDVLEKMKAGRKAYLEKQKEIKNAKK